ncbi:MAG: hypothetical protein H7308_20315 [Chthonomonadaceae bacterium]|nr:hypothetical protein [Chthonomonadaceae bacterium]
MKTTFWTKTSVATALIMMMGTLHAVAQDEPKPLPNTNGTISKKPSPGGWTAHRPLTLSMLPPDYLKSELKLTDEQVVKIESLQKASQADMMKIVEDPTAPPPPSLEPSETPLPPDQEEKLRAFEKKISTVTDKADEDVKAVLTEEQTKLLPSLMKETQSLVDAGLPLTLLTDLKLTPDQKKQIGSALDEMDGKLKDATPEDRRAKMKVMRKELREKVTGILTDEQKEMLKKSRENEKSKKEKS